MLPPRLNQSGRERCQARGSKLSATPEMIWLPLRLIEARPWMPENIIETPTPAEQAEPDIAGDRGNDGGGEGGGQHLALEPDIDDAGALGIEAGEAGEDQRRRRGGSW